MPLFTLPTDKNTHRERRSKSTVLVNKYRQDETKKTFGTVAEQDLFLPNRTIQNFRLRIIIIIIVVNYSIVLNLYNPYGTSVFCLTVCLQFSICWWYICLSVFLSCLFVKKNLPVCLLIYPVNPYTTCLSIYLSILLSVICMHVCLFILLSA